MTDQVVVLTGGVGGSKLVDGLCQVLPAHNIVAVVNTGDDFEHLGLYISPDVDTLLYTLSCLADPVQGWGRADESWNFFETLGALGGEQWFRLGDRDLALHVLRSQAIREGIRLSAVIQNFARRLGVETSVLPMTDDPVATMVDTDEGLLPFQRYFVERRCEPQVRSIQFAGAASARPGPGVIEAISDPSTAAVLIAPSNPFLSIDPVLAVPGIRAALAGASAPVVAVSPLVGGQAVKGPTAKIMKELGLPLSAATIADHYSDFLDGILVDERDPPQALAVDSARTDTLMVERQHRGRVARAALDLADRLRR